MTAHVARRRIFYAQNGCLLHSLSVDTLLRGTQGGVQRRKKSDVTAVPKLRMTPPPGGLSSITLIN